MGQTGCEGARDPDPRVGSCGRAPGPGSAHHGHTHKTGRLGQPLVGADPPWEGCEGWWSR